MAKSALSAFAPVSGCSNLYHAVSGGLRAFAFSLSDGNLCIFNPVAGISDEIVEQLEQIGPVKYLLTPNHYHNKALKEYVERYPKAKLCASNAAIPRLEKLTGLKFSKTTLVEKRLPETMQLIHTQGLKTGEVWLSATMKTENLWIVGDAFGGSKPARNKPIAQPGLLKTFPNFGIADAQTYKSWALGQIAQDQPTIVMPCHGDVFASKQLPARLASLLNRTF